MKASELVGTDLVQAVPLVASAALGHILFGDFQLGLTTSLLVGSIPGRLGRCAVVRAGARRSRTPRARVRAACERAEAARRVDQDTGIILRAVRSSRRWYGWWCGDVMAFPRWGVARVPRRDRVISTVSPSDPGTIPELKTHFLLRLRFGN